MHRSRCQSAAAALSRVSAARASCGMHLLHLRLRASTAQQAIHLRTALAADRSCAAGPGARRPSMPGTEHPSSSRFATRSRYRAASELPLITDASLYRVLFQDEQACHEWLGRASASPRGCCNSRGTARECQGVERGSAMLARSEPCAQTAQGQRDNSDCSADRT